MLWNSDRQCSGEYMDQYSIIIGKSESISFYADSCECSASYPGFFGAGGWVGCIVFMEDWKGENPLNSAGNRNTFFTPPRLLPSYK
jgi:hypothetical protein